MAVAGSSSSWNYDVFISFRGEDTRKIFVGHLYRALEQKAIHTFIDSEELRKGNDLSKLLNAIEDSRLSIVVLSENYASSTWCLKELVKILECMEAQNQIVVPVFYEVDPSHVRNLKGSFAQAFAKHEDSNADQEEVHGWKTALTRATNLSGWDSRHYKDDGELIEKIVEDTFHKLIHVSSSKPHGLVGMDYHLNEMYSLLGLGVNDVRFIGIWGMGGIGKTTIARAVYDEIASQFDHCCFLDNVKEGFTKKGTAQIQEDLVSRILKEKVPSTGSLNRGFNMIMKRLGKKRVLLVLDDLDDMAQIETLLGEQHSFGGGSRIILTTRYIQSLSGVEYRLYKPECLSYTKAHELFTKYAFRMNKPSGEYDHLSWRAINYAQGLPLALKVLGASLYNKSIPAWEDTLEKLKETPQREIQDVLRTSFDGLEPSEKNIFLDVACFFRGDNKVYATNILNMCGFFPKIGLEVLVDKALITFGYDDRIEMHDLLAEMGRKIGRTSRLWSYEDISRVLTENTATEAVEAIKIDLSPLDGKEIYLNTEAFVSMTKLRLLIIDRSYRSYGRNWCKQHVSGDLKFLSSMLRRLVWHECPLKSLPSNFEPLNLVDLIMPRSHIEQLWEGTKPLRNLKSIDLSDSHCLRKFPDCSQATNLEILDLGGCTSLLEVHSSNSALENLVLWSLLNCEVLETLPSSIHMKSLKTFILSGCSNLVKFPEISGIMKELAELHLDETAIVELPPSINNLPGLVTLSPSGCKELTSLPSSIHFKSLKSLILSGCSNLARFPEISGILKELAELRLDETAIVELPSSITNNLPGLVTLSLKGCKELKRLPTSIVLKSLNSLILSGCSNLKRFPEIRGIMNELPELCLDETGIEELPSSIENLTGLVTLSLKGCTKLKRLPSSICQLKSLKYLILSGCSKFEVFPIIIEDMEELRELHLDGTFIKEFSPSIARLKRLRILNMRNCKSLVCLPDNICNLSYLTGLILSGCSNIYNLPENCGIMESLLDLEVEGSDLKQLPLSLLETTAPFPSWSSSNLVGMVSHVNQMKLLLRLDQEDVVRFVGVCGVGGIGKTTIASVVYDKIACQFEYHCFLENVKEGFTKKGETQMRKELLSRMLTEKVQSVGTLSRGSNMIMENLGKKKVLLVLDNVDDIAQIETLLGQQYAFGGGSRIIITTRDEQILSEVNAMTYCPGLLTYCPALALFRQFAFTTVEPSTEYRLLSRHIIQFAQGLPLALEVLGAFLYYKSSCVWEDVLEKFKKNGHLGIQQVLRTSFDGLDDSAKSIFLDVACFFKGMKKDYAIAILQSCGFFPYVGLKVLIDTSLIAISHKDDTLKMHDLLQDMGWEIVRQEHVEEPGKRSRLWRYDDVQHVLTSNTGTEAVEVITLDLSNYKEVYLNARAFDKMVKLRLLQIHDNGSMDCKQYVNGDFKFLSRELRCLIWHRCPLKSLPSNFHPESLVHLDMCFSHLEQLWEGTKPLRELQFINLSHSPYLRKTSDMTETPRLKKLILEGCTSLFEVHRSLWYHDTLVFLNLKGCREFKMFPSSICMRSLRTLDLSGCSNLDKFPEISEDMIWLSEIGLDETAIKELPSSIGRLRGLQVLSMRNCRSLVSLPDSICNLEYLEQVYLAGCSKLYNLPDNLRNAQALTILELQGSGIEKLPFFMGNKETVREGVIKVFREGTSSESGTGMQVEECSEGGGIWGALRSCLSCQRNSFIKKDRKRAVATQPRSS